MEHCWYTVYNTGVQYRLSTVFVGSYEKQVKLMNVLNREKIEALGRQYDKIQYVP